VNAEEYMKLPYHVRMVRDDSGDGDAAWAVWVEELKGCVSQGDTPEEAATMIQEAMEGWFETALEHGKRIPPPRAESSHSGRFVVRLPVSLHQGLAEEAAREGVSLNQFVSAALSAAVGWRRLPRGAHPIVPVVETAFRDPGEGANARKETFWVLPNERGGWNLMPADTRTSLGQALRVLEVPDPEAGGDI